MLMEDFTRQYLVMCLKMKNDQNNLQAEVQVFKNKASEEFKYQPLRKYKNFGKQYGYFLSLIDLAAELCLGRNQLAFTALQEIYNFDSVKTVVKDNHLPFEMRALFMRLLLNMHMNQKLDSL